MSISKLDVNILYEFFDLIIPSNEKMPPASEVITEEELVIGVIDFEIINKSNSKGKNLVKNTF